MNTNKLLQGMLFLGCGIAAWNPNLQAAGMISLTLLVVGQSIVMAINHNKP